MHCYLEKNPNLLDIVLARLPSDVFSESTRVPHKTEKRKNKRQLSPTASEDMISSFQDKNIAVKEKIIFDRSLKINSEIRMEKKQQRDLFSELRMYCDGSSKVAKERVKKYKTYIEMDDDDYEDSQELLIEYLIKTDKNIDRLEKIKRATDEKIDGLI